MAESKPPTNQLHYTTLRARPRSKPYLEESEWSCGCGFTTKNKSEPALRQFKKLLESSEMKRELRAHERYKKLTEARRRK